jgi:MFS family permease
VNISLAALPTSRRPLAALLAANAVSLVGNVLAAMAIPWYVLETTGSASKTGLVGFVTLVPTVLGAFFGGGIVDRVGQKRISVIADLASGASVALIPLLHATVGLAFWQLLVLVFLGALLDAPGGTARTALYPEMIDAAGIQPERAHTAYQGVQRLSQMLGPAMAGVLIAGVGPATVLWLNAASFAVSAALVAAAVPESTATPARGRYLDDIREGFTVLRRDRLMRAVVVTVTITNLLDSAIGAVAMPVLAKDVYGSAQALGVMFAGFGAGAVAGSFIFFAVGHRVPRRAAYLTGFIVMAANLWVMAAMPALPVLVASRFLSGMAASPINPILMTVFQARVPPELRGRVLGTTTAAVLSAAPVGVLAAGYLIEGFGLQTVVGVVAAVYLLTTLSLVFNPALREMDRQPALAP